MGLEQGDTGIIDDDGGSPAGVITDASGDRRLQVEATITRPAASSAFFRGPLEDGGGSDDQVVNGSGTPVVFQLDADPTDDIELTELRIVFSADSFDWDGTSFGRGSALANGILIELDIGGVVTEIDNIVINEDWLILPARSGALVDQVSASAVLAISSELTGVVLEGGSSDLIRSTIRDNITLGSRGASSLRMVAFGSM
jgi:hypothetical protein